MPQRQQLLPTHLRLASSDASASSLCMMGTDMLSARWASLELATCPAINTLTATWVPAHSAT